MKDWRIWLAALLLAVLVSVGWDWVWSKIAPTAAPAETVTATQVPETVPDKQEFSVVEAVIKKIKSKPKRVHVGDCEKWVFALRGEEPAKDEGKKRVCRFDGKDVDADQYWWDHYGVALHPVT